MRGATIEPLAVASKQDRAFVAFADGKVDRACGTRYQWDHRGLVALTEDSQCSMTTFKREVLDVRCGSFGDAESLQAEQHGWASSGDQGGSSAQIAVSAVSSVGMVSSSIRETSTTHHSWSRLHVVAQRDLRPGAGGRG